MPETKTFLPFVVTTPPAESLAEPESFVIDSIQYHVFPDVTTKVHGGTDGKYFFLQSKGFAGREFVIVTNDGRHIVTRNLWMGEGTDLPDTAAFEGAVAKPVRVTRHSWDVPNE